jgi:aerobic carbon-monoxide dehydrogenase medium subunit
VKPAPFEYHRPGTLDEALGLLASHGGDATPLAGGQSLIPAMNFRLAAPSVLVDLNDIAALSYVTAADGALRIGSMTRQRTLERSDRVAALAPLLSMTLPFVAHTAVRTRGTIGGSLAHADPAAELPAVMLALNATFTARSHTAERQIVASGFFTGLFSTALASDELLTAVAIPALPPRTGCAFQEISRRHGDYALAGAAAMVSLDDRGRCTGVRVALLSVGEAPVLATHASDVLDGHAPSPEAIRAAAEAARVHDVDPPGDIHASSAYRRHLAGVLTRRVLEQACAAAQARAC